MASFPKTRLRRTRQYAWLRDMVADVSLTPKDLVLPLFLREESDDKEIKTLPSVERYSISELPSIVEKALTLGIPAVALFPKTPTSLKNNDGSESFNPHNLVCDALSLLKKTFGHDLGLITDVALDPYTSHGHDGIINEAGIDNDLTVSLLTKQALTQAQAGTDILAPSDMMDGRIGAIREALDHHGYQHTLLMSYAAKYATHFYGPFRDAVGAGSIASLDHPELRHKKTYQMDYRRQHEALREVAQDIEEGADMLMIKPATLMLDILYRIKSTYSMPTFAYHVSGEYACLKLMQQQGLLVYEDALLEILYGLKRAGADGIFTYGAMDAAALLKV